jgi:hypothetical protein
VADEADADDAAEVAKVAVAGGTGVFMGSTLALRAEVGAKPISMHLAINLMRSLF